MSSYLDIIGTAAAAKVGSLAGAPSSVIYEMEDVLHPREVTTAIMIVTNIGEDEYPLADASGAGDDFDQGDIGKAYQYVFSLYKPNTGNMIPGTTQDFILACQQALLAKSLTGAPTVFGSKFIRRPSAWEAKPFGEGAEVSSFSVVFYSAERRLGP